ncbi:Bug family tripartite tricarboxylate transporter substrate binding protein [Halalkalibacter okhensis]|uniref:Tripartite-type tricarboxylate transporter, receptor component TctC n=1 Tax=Halalkalibacter okhensis TaxID=333138 RepID=A0A0B0I7Z3_9BACI|nr:tripartite tricarboxylate transporter substrate-binding protein [Halalkalibacter okhensis]KHF38618.1 hypothetical protein LQ50_20070 [Halalkalibacter okhensis]
MSRSNLLLISFVMLFSLMLIGCSTEKATEEVTESVAIQNKLPKEEQNEDLKSFYEGKRISFIVPYDPGAGYDMYARMMAPYIEEYTGANVVVNNLPGAGGMRGVNELYGAPSDGLTIGIMNGSAMVTNQIAEIAGARYNLSEFGYLGRIVADTRVLTMAADGPYQTFEDILDAGGAVKLGATGLGGSTYVDAVVISEALGLNTEVLHGYDSVVEPAILRGEVDGTWGSYGSRKVSIDEGITIPILQSGNKRNDELLNVPTVSEVLEKADNLERASAIIEVWNSLNSVGRPLAVPPGVPRERLEFLQEVFDKVMADERFIVEAKQSDRDLLYASGEEMLEIAIAATKIEDEEVKQIIINAIEGEL